MSTRGLELALGLRRTGRCGSRRGRAPRAPSPSRARAGGRARARSPRRARCRRRAGACPPGTRRRRRGPRAVAGSFGPPVGRGACGSPVVQPNDIPEPGASRCPNFSPFAGVRYDCDAAGAGLGVLAAPPYDVVDEDEHAALEASHPHNSVRLILPRDEHAGRRPLRRGPPPRSRRGSAAGVLFVDERPALLRLPDGVPRRRRARLATPAA